jgi:hypothetical protein
MLISIRIFLFPIFLFAAQPKELFLDVLKKLEQRSHKRVELSGEYVELIHFFLNPVACCFLYKDKDLSAPLVDICVDNQILPILQFISWFVVILLRLNAMEEY